MNKLSTVLIMAMSLDFSVANAETKAVDSKPGPISPEVTVYRSPTCSCCEKWVEHIKASGFKVNDNVTEDVQAIKNKYKVTAEMASCHTALVDGYVVEGHVPVEDIEELLKTKPKVLGISVPGMPVGTPGMEMGGRKDAYQVMSFNDKPEYKVFKSYQAN